MAASATRDAASRLKRHIIQYAFVFAVGLGLNASGFVADMPDWALPTMLVVVAVGISQAYKRWGADADRTQIHFRAVLQTMSLMFVAYYTGWGPILVPVFLFAVADNMRYSGSRAARPIMGWSFAAVGVGQLFIHLDLLPTMLPRHEAHGLAVLGATIIFVVANRMERTVEAQEAAEAELASSERRIRALIEGSSDVTLVISDAHITYQSPSATQVFGYDEDSLLQKNYLALVHPDDIDDVVDQVKELLAEPGSTGYIRQRIRHADGHWIATETACRNLVQDEDINGFVVNIRDVSDRHELEMELEHRAFHDSLTGLANRALLRDRLEHTVARGVRQDIRFGLLYLDLDGFKVINDTLGHAIGDSVLFATAEILRSCLRDADTAARLGGDEFAILLEDLRDQSDAARVASRILEKFSEPLLIDGKEVNLNASIGIAMHARGDDAEGILRNADIAMYMAKNSGKGRYEIFEPSMHLAVVERLQLENDLQRALERDELLLHYQPIVHLDNGTVTGVEALVRWQHPERGMVSPGEFIPVAEDTGLVIPLGRWVLREACSQVVAWQKAYPTQPPLHVSVNVSMKQVSHGDIVSDVADALKESGLDPECLTLELTESALVQDPEDTIQVLHKLKALGVRLAIDDFGTGYSSLSYLQRFPVDILKIDRSFVEGLVSGKQNPALVRAIVEMGRSLKLETVAEGIEHDEELNQFRNLQCSFGQGYLFARPAGRDDITSLLAELTVEDGASARIPIESGKR